MSSVNPNTIQAMVDALSATVDAPRQITANLSLQRVKIVSLNDGPPASCNITIGGNTSTQVKAQYIGVPPAAGSWGMAIVAGADIVVLGPTANNSLAAVDALAGNLIAGFNIIRNPGFEIDADGDGFPDFWTPASGGVSGTNGLTLTATGYTGFRGLHIQANSANDFYTYQTVVLAPGYWVIGAMVQRTNVVSVGGAGSGINIDLTSGAFTIVLDWQNGTLSDLMYTGTNDWRYEWRVINVTSTATVRIYCQQGYAGNCTGSTDFDMVSCQPGRTPTMPTGNPPSDGVVPPFSPAPTILAGLGALYVSWNAVANYDPVTYDVHISSANGFTPSANTLHDSTEATVDVIKTVSLADGAVGTPLTYGVTYYVKIVARDRDGSAAASAQASGVPLLLNTSDAAQIRNTSTTYLVDSTATNPATPASDYGATGPGGVGQMSFQGTGMSRLAGTTAAFGGMALDYDGTWASGTVPQTFGPYYRGLARGHYKLVCYIRMVDVTTAYYPNQAVAKMAIHFQDSTIPETDQFYYMTTQDLGNSSNDPNVTGVSDGRYYAVAVDFHVTADITSSLGIEFYVEAPNETPFGSTVNMKLMTWRISHFVVLPFNALVANEVTANYIAANSIVAGKLAVNSVIAGNIAAGVIVAGNIAASTITSAQIAASTIVAGNIAARTITAAQIAVGTLTATEIAAHTITANEIAAATITGDRIVAGTITATQIAGGTITAGQIAAGTITATQIAAGTITATQIAAGTITGTEIAASISLTSPVITGGTLRTAASGQRVEISSGAANYLRMWSGAAGESSSGALFIGASGGGGNLTNFLTLSSGAINSHADASLVLQSTSSDGSTTSSTASLAAEHSIDLICPTTTLSGVLYGSGGVITGSAPPLRSRSNGNNISFDWDGTYIWLYVDNSWIAKLHIGYVSP